MHKLLIAVVALSLAHPSVGAVEEPEPLYPGDPGKLTERAAEQDARYRCFHENDARRTTCIDGTLIAFNGSIRAAELLIGRPERVRATGVYLVVDCKTARSALRNGVGTPLVVKETTVSAETSRALAQEICALPPMLRNHKLKLD
jgi:hypothetical protein